MILTLNAGSSSLKYAVFDASGKRVLSGLHERLDGSEAQAAALGAVIAELRSLDHLRDLTAVAHRVVHGGERFRAPTRITPAVEAAIAELAPLAPLHNPVNLAGIRAAQRVLAEAGQAELPHVAVFDTAFHATLPEHAYRYPVPEAWYTEHGVRRYGFHGSSHAFVSAATRRVLAKAGRAHGRMVTLHLGNGCSATAIRDGVSIDTSMGLTPLAGLMMGTRPGDLDPGIAGYLARRGVGLDEQEQQLNRASGLRAIAGASDVRELLAEREAGSLPAKRALAMFAYRIRKQVGAYAAALGGLDALVFTAGIGENSAAVREEVCAGLGFLGVELDAQANQQRSDAARFISSGATAVLVLPTDEERYLAEAASGLLRG